MNIIFIIGAPGAGKTAFGRMLAEELGGICRDTSEVVIRQWEELTGEHYDARYKEAFRADLVKVGDVIASQDKARILRLILAEHELPVKWLVVCGIRRRLELEACTDLAEELCAHIRIIWIERKGAKYTDNLELRADAADSLIFNHEGLDILRTTAELEAEDIMAGAVR